MEISDISSYVLRVPIGRTVGDSRLSVTDVYWIVVEIDTDVGISGTGWMGSLGFGPALLAQFVDSQFADILVGRNPFELGELHDEMRTQTIYYGEVGMSAWPRGAIDVALWDIKAQTAEQPLYRFLGGSDRRVPVYASSMDATIEEVDDLIATHQSHANEGFRAFKTKVGGRSPASERERVRRLRDALGDDVRLFADANQAWTVNEARQHVANLSEVGIDWIEEPISEFDIDGHVDLVDRITPPLASGEMYYRPERFEYLLASGGLDIVQPDLIRNGGLSGMMEVSTLAHRHHVPLAPHFYYAVSGHVVSAAPTGLIAEYIPEYDIAPILDSPPSIDDGTLVLPDRPGHGYSISQSARNEYEVSVTELRG